MNDSTDPSYEISLADIFRALWNGRGIIVVVSVLAALSVAAYFGISMLTTSPMATYYISLRNIENNRYPNGAVFSSQDLLLPQVLTEMQNRLNLQNLDGLRQSISVIADSPISLGIVLKYRQRLDVRGLSQAEIDAINLSFQEELNASTRSHLRIDVDYASLDLSSEMGKAIARELPEAWTKVFSTQFQVFTDRRLADMSTVTNVADLSADGSFVSALLQLKIMKNGLQSIITDNRFSLFRIPNGPSAGDIANTIVDFERTLFMPLRYASYAGDDFISLGYRKSLEMESAEIRSRIDAVDRGIEKIRDIQPRIKTEIPSDPTNSAERDVLQLGESALSPIVELANRANFSEFIQSMVRDRTELEYRLSELKAELDVFSSRQTEPARPEILKVATERLQQIVDDYKDLISLIEKQTAETAGRFFEPYLGPTVPNLFFSRRYLFGIVLAGFIGFIFASALVLGHRTIIALRK